MADVVVAVAGGAGTLSEIALAWQLGRPVIALASTGGWAERLAGRPIDARRDEVVFAADDPQAAVAAAVAMTSTESAGSEPGARPGSEPGSEPGSKPE